MKLPPLRLLVLDTETTGFVPVIHRVIEYACAVTEDGKLVMEYEQLLSSTDNNEIPAIVQTLTQIKPEDLVGKPTFGDIFEKIEAMLTPETVVVGQNINFDLRMLKGEGWDITDAMTVDTAMLASIVYPELKSYSLGFMSETLGLTHEPKHRALGDVRATLQMLGLCVERLQSLPVGDLKALQAIAAKGPVGYRRLFESLVPENNTVKRPKWLSLSRHSEPAGDDLSIPASALPLLQVGSVQAVQESLHPASLASVIAGAKKGTVIAVKNLDAILRRVELSDAVTILPSPDTLISKEAAEAFLKQQTYTADEMTLAMKLTLYRPESKTDLPIHGDEYAVWAARLAASAESAEYRARTAEIGKSVVLTSHYELVNVASSDASPLSAATPVIIDDASMLEDTATAALGWTCLVSTLRAAAGSDDAVTKCVDLVELWAEKVRGGTDLRYLAPSDLEADDVVSLKTIIAGLKKDGLSHASKRALEDLLLILDPANLPGRITWIESFQVGSKAIKSVPEKIAEVLADLLYRKAPVTLVVPSGTVPLDSIIPGSVSISPTSLAMLPAPGISVALPMNVSTDQLIASTTKKSVILVGSKRAIEDIFVKHAKKCEDAGVTLLCQGFSGGQSRMQAEFAVAATPAILVATPWMYETMELPAGTIDSLALLTLPFDHPSHAVFSRRAHRHLDPFNGYSLPRLMHRLFRLVRTFRRHSAPGGTIIILDDRLRTKQYGKTVSQYLMSFGSAATVKPAAGGQLSLL